MNRNSQVKRFISTLIERNLSLAFAESMTCGLAAHQLSTVKGTAEVLQGSVVCYTGEMKNRALGVSMTAIRRHSAESQQVTNLMAEKLVSVVKADVYAAITGLAAPGGSETVTKPVGTVFFAVRYRNKTHSKRVVYRGTPLEIRQKAVLGVYEFILQVTR
jgi:nicotinamide-nucleotide amidase